MAESYSVKARLSAVDSGFSSTLKGAMGMVDSFGSKLTSGFNFGFLAGAGQQAFSAISNTLSSCAKETLSTSDAMQKLQQAMRFSGESEAEIERIAGSTGTLKTYADKTVFSLQDVMSTFGALSANGVKDADKLTESVGNAVAVFGGGAQEFSSVALAFSQSMAAGKMNAQDWNQVLNASPQLAGGLKKELQKLSPVLAKDFKGGLEKGAITADLLAKAMNNIGMTDMAKEAAQSVTTFEGAMGNLEATVQSGMLTLYDSFGKEKLIGAINMLSSGVGKAFDWLAGAVPKAIQKMKPYWDTFVDSITRIKRAVLVSFKRIKKPVMEAFTVIKNAFASINGEDLRTSALDTFAIVCARVSDAIIAFSNFIVENQDAIKKYAPYVAGLVGAFVGLKVVNTIAPGLTSFAGSLLKMAGKGIAGLAAKLFGIAGGQKAVGGASASSGPSILQAAVATLALGAAVLLAAVGMALLVQSAIALASAGWPAVAALAGLVAVVALLAIGAAALGPALTAGAIGFIAFGGAIALIGAGAALAGLGLSLIAGALPLVIAYGSQASVALMELGKGLAVFAVGAGLTGAAVIVLGTGLLLVASALLVAGAAMILFGVGALIAAGALALITLVMPTLVQYGAQAAIAIVQLGGGLLVFGAGALVAGAGAVVLGAGLLMVASAVLVLSAGILVLSVGALLVAASLAIVAAVLPLIAAHGTAGASAIVALGASMLVFAVGAGVAGVAALALSVGLVAAAVGIAASAVAVGLLAVSMTLLAASTLLAAAGFGIIGAAILAIVEYGASAGRVLVGMNLPLLAFVPAATVAGVAATALAVGFAAAAIATLAFGVAITALGVGMMVLAVGCALAAGGMLLLSLVLPLLAANAQQNAIALATLGMGLLAFAPGALAAGAAAIVLGAGLTVVAVAVAALGIGIIALGAGILVLSVSALVAAASLALLATQLPTIAAYGLQGAAAIAALGASMLVFAAGAGVAGLACAALALGLGALALATAAASISVGAFGIAIAASAIGVAAMGLALKAVQSSMKSISKNAKSTEKSLDSMQDAISVVESGLDALGDMAKSAMKKLTGAFDDTASDVMASGTKVGTGFAMGMMGGLALAPAIANQSIMVVNVALLAGYAKAYNAGAYMSKGFANGMLSQLAVIRRAAAQMAEAADAAVRAKAKIHSPSRVAEGLGEYWGEGYVGGILSTVKDAWNAAEQLVSIPQVATPKLAMSYGGELASDYSYSNSAEYIIEVPVTMDGKEIARVSAPYTQAELNRRETRDSRKKGKV